MVEKLTVRGGLIADLVVLGLLVGSLLASGCIWLLGDWEQYGWWLRLTLRIIWGCWIVVFLATMLTKVTIFGWSFRRYFRWNDKSQPPPQIPRPTRAPWSKSGLASFSFTVSLVALTGIIALASIVMWILKDVVGDWIFWLVIGILGSVWWIAAITLVLVRITLFGLHKRKIQQLLQESAQTEQSAEPVNTTSQG
jgi:hypothetical protein